LSFCGRADSGVDFRGRLGFSVACVQQENVMYAVIRSFPQMQNVEEAGRLAETGLAPILKQQPGFRAYYVIRLEGGGGGSISLFDSADNARAAHDRSLAWIKENLAGMIGGATPVVTMGEVLAEVSAEAVA
jgi:hypothetical protein